MDKYIVYDWAGNLMNFGQFDDFEDAWGFIYEKFDHLSEQAFDEEMQEYQVLNKESTNETL